MEGVEMQPHIKLTKSDVHPVALVFGDPARGELVASLCDSATELECNREYRSWSCTHRGFSFTAISHGVGSSGCTVCISELLELGVKVVIRAGTAGSFQLDTIKQGDVVIGHAAVKGDGTSRLLEPIEIPAVADWDVTAQLRDSSKAMDVKAQYVIVHADDLFYKSKVVPSLYEQYRDAKVGVVEMESAAIFTICRHYGAKAGTILAVDGSPFAWKSGDYDPHGTRVAEGKKNMLLVAIHACSELAKEYKETDAFVLREKNTPWIAKGAEARSPATAAVTPDAACA